MVSVTASINLPVEIWQKSKDYRLNRSAIARNAIALEIDRIENVEKAQMIATAAKHDAITGLHHSSKEGAT